MCSAWHEPYRPDMGTNLIQLKGEKREREHNSFSACYGEISDSLELEPGPGPPCPHTLVRWSPSSCTVLLVVLAVVVCRYYNVL